MTRKKTGNYTKKYEIELSQIIEQNSIPTFVIDHEHRVIHYNRACENLTGILAKDMIGTKNQWKAFYPNKRPVMADLLVDSVSEDIIKKHYGDKFKKSDVIKGGYEAEGFFSHLGEDGKWLFFTAAPLKNPDGKIIGALETLQDITERKRAEAAIIESQIRYRTLLDFVPYPIVVTTLDRKIFYINPAFSDVFGWSQKEIAGKKIPYIPDNLKEDANKNFMVLKKKKALQRYITKRKTKDGRIIDVAVTATLYSGFHNEPGGILEIMRDITWEIWNEKRQKAILRISQSLPEYPDLEELLDFISREIKRLTNTEGALVILLDEEKQELFFMGAAFDDEDREKRVKGIRFGLTELVAGEVIRTGEPVIVHDTSKTEHSYPERDKKFGYHTRNFLLVPLRSGERIIGVLGAINIKEGQFDQSHVELLSMVAGTVALSVENARFSHEIKKAYRKLSENNRAKDKAINHLSHELKTPLSVLGGSLKILENKLKALPDKKWKSAMDRATRNLERLSQIQDEAEDIMQGIPMTKILCDNYMDLIEHFMAKEMGELPAFKTVREKIEKLLTPKEPKPVVFDPAKMTKERIIALKPLFSHRKIDIIQRIKPCSCISMPVDAFNKIIDGLIRNAVENTPDHGKIEIRVMPYAKGSEIIIHDFGVGIIENQKKRIFEGFFTARDTMSYSSKNPFDFNAGGKGADLLRMKIFSIRYNFRIEMESIRCMFIPEEKDTCPGDIDNCEFCKDATDCFKSGQTLFSLIFPGARNSGG